MKADGTDPQQWVNLAMVWQNQQDEIGEEQAIRGALTAGPTDLLALILRAALLERQGKRHQAAMARGIDAFKGQAGGFGL